MHFNAIRANFVGQSGNLDTILHTALKRPLPVNEETQYIYERFTPLDDSFFEDNLKLIDKHPTFEFHRQRLSYFLRAQDPTSPLVKMTAEEWGRYRAINEGRNVDWEPIEGDVAKKVAARDAFFDDLFDNYDELMYMHLTPKLKVLKRTIQDYCCDGLCAKAYWHYFRRHPRTSNEWAQSDFSKLTAEEKQKIRNRAEKWGRSRTSQSRRME
jgi:hypothetical protein